MSDFKCVYDAIVNASNEVTNFAIDNLYPEYAINGKKCSKETQDKIKKLRDAMSIVRDAAHELNEHLAWDDVG